MLLLASTATLGSVNAQQVMQLNGTATRTEVVKPSSILVPGPNVILMTKTESAVIPGTDPTADIHTPSLLPPGTELVKGLNGCDTAIILPGMADMPAAQVADVLQTNSTAAVVPPAPAPTETTTIRKVTTTKVFRQVRTKKAPRKSCKRIKRSSCKPVKKSTCAPAMGS